LLTAMQTGMPCSLLAINSLEMEFIRRCHSAQSIPVI
jgi:hypothetical protein